MVDPDSKDWNGIWGKNFGTGNLPVFFFFLVTFIPYYIYYICNVSDFYTKAMVLCKSCKKNYIGWISISADNRGLNISTEENI